MLTSFRIKQPSFPTKSEKMFSSSLERAQYELRQQKKKEEGEKRFKLMMIEIEQEQRKERLLEQMRILDQEEEDEEDEEEDEEDEVTGNSTSFDKSREIMDELTISSELHENEQYSSLSDFY
jgi:hypothetical protein